ncbi:MAG: stage 0 sporulation family protein [Clostridia bacterium]|nr:stage 0 sporulation family protein [Clostridia bacterium]
MELVEIVGVRFKSVGKIYYFDPCGNLFKNGDRVIVETVRGLEIGTVVVENRQTEKLEKFTPLSPVIRLATQEDIETDKQNREKEKAAFAIFEEKTAKHGLEMNLVDVEYSFDNNKIIFFFVADGRVDFRELVKDLASVFKTRIELRQIGVRDETRMIGGLGICGRKVCCASFLSEFTPVSVKMAKDQSLSTNPQKISGTCGKLICCLNFEEAVYEEAYQTMPRAGYTVKTPDGQGTVVEVNVLTSTVRVNIGSEREADIRSYNSADVKTISRTADEENNSELAAIADAE